MYTLLVYNLIWYEWYEWYAFSEHSNGAVSLGINTHVFWCMLTGIWLDICLLYSISNPVKHINLITVLFNIMFIFVTFFVNEQLSLLDAKITWFSLVKCNAITSKSIPAVKTKARREGEIKGKNVHSFCFWPNTRISGLEMSRNSIKEYFIQFHTHNSVSLTASDDSLGSISRLASLSSAFSAPWEPKKNGLWKIYPSPAYDEIDLPKSKPHPEKVAEQRGNYLVEKGFKCDSKWSVNCWFGVSSQADVCV